MPPSPGLVSTRPAADFEQLIPYARNAPTHSPQQVAQIAASINEHGFCNPVLTDPDGGIIAGHGRVLAARKLGLTEVPVIVLGHLSKNQRQAFVLADGEVVTQPITDGRQCPGPHPGFGTSISTPTGGMTQPITEGRQCPAPQRTWTCARLGRVITHPI
jgi:hypothetical protein